MLGLKQDVKMVLPVKFPKNLRSAYYQILKHFKYSTEQARMMRDWRKNNIIKTIHNQKVMKNE